MNPKTSRIAFLVALVFFVPFLTRAQEYKWDGPSVDFSHGDLQVSPNRRYLQFEDGSPFFYLGDTAWELFHRLDKEEAEKIRDFPASEPKRFDTPVDGVDWVLVLDDAERKFPKPGNEFQNK